MTPNTTAALVFILALVAGAIVWASIKLGAFLHARERVSNLWHALAVLSDAVTSIVADLNATLVPQLKAAAADGQLSAADITLLRQTALARVKAYFSDHGLGLLMQIIGVVAPSVDAYLSGLIESKVAALPSVDAPVVVGLPAREADLKPPAVSPLSPR